MGHPAHHASARVSGDASAAHLRNLFVGLQATGDKGVDRTPLGA